MKTIIKSLLDFFINIFSKIYSYEKNKKLNNLKNILYSLWIKKNIKECGVGFHVCKPTYLKGLEYMSIGNGFTSRERLRLECWDTFKDQKFTPKLIIGNDVKVNFNLHIGCINEVKIGNNVLLGSNIFITDHQHGYIDERDLGQIPISRNLSSKGPVIIDDNVWIGENVVIMPNVTIGKGCVIGANSVVTKSVPKNTIVAGIPAKVIRKMTN